MRKTYNLPNGTFTNVDGYTEIFTHTTGLQMLVNPIGEFVVIHPSDRVIIINKVTKTVKIYDSVGELLETFELTSDFEIKFDDISIKPCDLLS